MTTKPIYVETFITCTVDDVWAHTQEPEIHQRWDARFTSITYLPAVDGEPQQFLYNTKVGPRFWVDGRGETLGERHREDGTAYSGLKFWSDHPLSLIKSGAGYWRYVPTANGVRFLTRYNYQVRWGALGRCIDLVMFRPLFGWATAWSFDRLRLWIERGVPPEHSRNQTIAHVIAVLSLAFTWIYHGIVPKLLFPDSGELQLFEAASKGFFNNPTFVLGLIGIAETGFGFATLRWWQRRWPFLTTLSAMPFLTFGALAGDSTAFIRPFNPVTLNVSLMALAAIVLTTRNNLPSGRLPLRQPPPETATTEIPT